MAKLTENDVRLMRRSLVALGFGDEDSASKITKYLRVTRELEMILPSEQTKEQRERFLNRLLDKEKWLSREYGCILLPKYHDCIFLNSRWANPRTLYVRLNAPVEELGELGEIYWLPEDKKDKWKDLADTNHAAYIKATKKRPKKPVELSIILKKPKQWQDKLLGRSN